MSLPGLFATGLPVALSGIRKKRQLDREYREAGKPPHPTAAQMPETPLNRILSHGRTFVCDSMDLADLSRARIIAGATLNDVFLCCTAGALRRLLKDMNYDPSRGPLVAGIPVSGKRPSGMEGEGNFISTDFTWLHTEIEDPLERLEASHASAAEMKLHIEAARGSDLTSMSQLAPMFATRLIAWMIRKKGGNFGLAGNVAVSNVPGPRKPLYFGPMEVENWFSTGQVFDGSALNMTFPVSSPSENRMK